MRILEFALSAPILHVVKELIAQDEEDVKYYKIDVDEITLVYNNKVIDCIGQSWD